MSRECKNTNKKIKLFRLSMMREQQGEGANVHLKDFKAEEKEGTINSLTKG